MENKESQFDLAVIGAGVVGLATAYKYQLRHPKAKIAIFEKENRVAAHQTGRNSGVIHSGIYYKPGSFKAKNCIDGRRQLVSFANQHNVPHDICGKIILATNAEEQASLERIYKRGLENEIEDIQLIGPEEIQKIEPFAQGVQAIKVPVTGIIDFTALCEKFVELIQEINPQSQLFLSHKVVASQSINGSHSIHTDKGIYIASKKVFCAGLQADRMAKMEGIELDVAIVGFRGDYYDLTESGHPKVRHLIYPVPDPAFPFLGVHFTRMTDGSIECGPNAVFSFKREGYSRTAFDLEDTRDALMFPGTLKLFAKHVKKGLDEYRRAFSKRQFLRELQKMIPSLGMEDIKAARSGVRAQALNQDGSLVEDFKIVYGPGSIHVINAPSPAATACLSIADDIVQMIEKELK